MPIQSVYTWLQLGTVRSVSAYITNDVVTADKLLINADRPTDGPPSVHLCRPHRGDSVQQWRCREDSRPRHRGPTAAAATVYESRRRRLTCDVANQLPAGRRPTRWPWWRVAADTGVFCISTLITVIPLCYTADTHPRHSLFTRLMRHIFSQILNELLDKETTPPCSFVAKT